MTMILSRVSRFALIGLAIIGFGMLPERAHAQEAEPACTLIVSTPRGYDVFTGEKDIEIRTGERIIIGWIGQNASDRRDRNDDAIDPVGLVVLTGSGSGSYAYTFSDGDDEATCTANLEIREVVATPPPSAPTPVVGGALTFSSVPLLSGGSAEARASIPVAYIQVRNSGSAAASVEGFTLKQNGTASTDSVIGFSTSDNLGGSRTTIGGDEGYTQFEDGEAFVPLVAIIPAGQFRIFTLKATLGADSGGSFGKSLMLDVSDIDTTATIQGAFPIRGTTWTLAF